MFLRYHLPQVSQFGANHTTLCEVHMMGQSRGLWAPLWSNRSLHTHTVRPTVHPYHQVDVSPWPILMSQALQAGAVVIVGLQTSAPLNGQGLFGWLVQGAILLIAFQWWRDVIREAKGGYHTSAVQRGILIGFLLFLLSEIMLFVSLFWAFFHSSLAPAIQQGSTWPPIGVSAVNPWAIPLQGTALLQGSSFVLTLGHHATIGGNKDQALISIQATVALGAQFVYFQYQEYSVNSFTISDSVFGSVFYTTTGAHGVHVIVGVVFLSVCLIRLFQDHFTIEHHLGLEFAIWYYHLVDVVWLFVFLTYYWWGS